MAVDGFDAVERRATDGSFWLVNTARNEEMQLDNAGDSQLARVAITSQAAQNVASPTGTTNDGQDTGTAGTGLGGQLPVISGNRSLDGAQRDQALVAGRGRDDSAGAPALSSAAETQSAASALAATENSAALEQSSLNIASYARDLTALRDKAKTAKEKARWDEELRKVNSTKIISTLSSKSHPDTFSEPSDAKS